MAVIELNNSLRKRFSSDFKLPINIFSDPYFSYFIELYDETHKVKEKLEWFHQVLDKCENSEDFFTLSDSITKNVKNLISSSNAYQQLGNVDMNKVFPLDEQVKTQNIYIDQNVGRKLISIDLEKANFNSLDMFDLKKEINAHTYEQLLRHFTDEKYFLESKKIRQVIFGDLNPTRQQRIQKYIINIFCQKLKQAGCILTSASSDEIIVQNEEMTPALINEILKDVPEKMKFFRVEEFKFEKISEEHSYFAKTTYKDDGSEKLELKNIPGHFYAQIYKKHFNLTLNDEDLLFFHEGCLAQFKEPLFKEELNNTNNMSKKFKR